MSKRGNAVQEISNYKKDRRQKKEYDSLSICNEFRQETECKQPIKCLHIPKEERKKKKKKKKEMRKRRVLFAYISSNLSSFDCDGEEAIHIHVSS